MSNIDLFFEDPSIPPRQLPTYYGVLYLLRRDIKTCFDNIAEWPGIMAILAGVDLLGKFESGEDNYNNSSIRFKSFLKYFRNITENEKAIIYQLRNSLLHSFGLYSIDKKGNVYRFHLSKAYIDFIKQDGENYYINDLKLKENFNLSIDNYYKDLKNSKDLQLNFEKMFINYGAIYMSD